MNRRGFLGSIIGFCGAAAFPAVLTGKRWITPAHQGLRMAFRAAPPGAAGSYLLQAPGIKSIIPLDKGFEFVAEQLEIVRAMTVTSTLLLDERGMVLRETPFHFPVAACNGDALRVSQSIATDIPVSFNQFIGRLYENSRSRSGGAGVPGRVIGS